MAFEKFTMTGRSFRPVISIWSRGQIGFNQGAVNRCGIKAGVSIVLFFDREKGKIGFKIESAQGEEGALNPKISTTGAVISAKSFLDYYEIDYSTTTKYELGFDEEHGLFTVDINEGKITK